MAAKIDIRNLTERSTKKGRYYIWQPGPTRRKRGWKAVALKTKLDTHSSQAVAIAQTAWLNAILDAWSHEGPTRAAELQAAWSAQSLDAVANPPDELDVPVDYVDYQIPNLPKQSTAATPKQRTVQALMDLYMGDPKKGIEPSRDFATLSKDTQRDYRNRMKHVAATFGDAPVKGLKRKQLRNYYQAIETTRSITTANARMRVFSALLSFGIEEEWLEVNPLLTKDGRKFRKRQSPSRAVIWRPDEVAHLVAVGDAMDEAWAPWVVDAIIIAIHTSQRRGDILTMPQLLFASDRLALSQSKRGARVDIPYTPQLSARVAQIRARRRANGLDHVSTMLVDPITGRPLNKHTFGHRFAELRDKAAETFKEIERMPGEPAFIEKTFADTRDTAITRLALADLDGKGNVDLFSISAISGHSLAGITQILKHYVAMHRSMADRGIDTMVGWMKAQGIKV